MKNDLGRGPRGRGPADPAGPVDLYSVPGMMEATQI